MEIQNSEGRAKYVLCCEENKFSFANWKEIAHVPTYNQYNPSTPVSTLYGGLLIL